MIDVIELCSLIPKINSEISQEYNLNANTRLFVIEPMIVAKIWVRDRNAMKKSLTNLAFICNILDRSAFPELVFPLSFIQHNDEVIGYTMPYISGTCLAVALEQQYIPRNVKIDWFCQIADIINRLPSSIFIGDLHSNNVMVDTQNCIHLIDLDGFSVDGGYMLTCPLWYDNSFAQNVFVQKYFDVYCQTKVNRNTDIFCLVSMFFQFVFDGFNPFLFPHSWMECFFEFLKSAGISETTVSMIQQVTKEEDNFIDGRYFEDFKSTEKEISYQSFLQETKLCDEEHLADVFLRNVISCQLFAEEHA